MQLQLSLGVADRLHETLLVRGRPLDAIEAARMLLASPDAPVGLCCDILATLVRHDRRFVWDGAEAAPLSLRYWEVPDPDLSDVPFVALDLETTGARAGTSKITEIGAVRIEGFQVVSHFTTLVNPLRPIPPMIRQLTGISQDMVAGAPRIEQVMPTLVEFLEGAVVVAHNAAFDVGFLNYELRRLIGHELGEGAIDTLPLARALAPGLPNYRLRTVAAALDAPVAACHRALADAEAAAHVFITLVERLRTQGVARLGELRQYVNPSSRLAMDKLRLTRDLPNGPGTYQFVDNEGRTLYVGQAERLGETVRSHFTHGTGTPRGVRQALRLVERIDWEEACTPLEAVINEQRLILEYRPPCNAYGTRPERYEYIKVGRSSRGLSLATTCRVPKGTAAGDGATHSRRGVLLMGPFRGRARLHAAISLLQRCYPIRCCPHKPDGRPCARSAQGRCLAPCDGDPQKKQEHDALVLGILDWLAGKDDGVLPDPVERATEDATRLSRQHRHEEAQEIREACEHLLSIRRSYAALADACSLRFALLWPCVGNGAGPTVRLNLVCGGKLLDPLQLHPDNTEETVARALATLRSSDQAHRRTFATAPVAVPQEELDSVLAVRRWFYESQYPKMLIPGPEATTSQWELVRSRLVSEANVLLFKQGPLQATPLEAR